MKRIVEGIRIILTVILLYIIWHHAHWSVAFCLTGLSIANEANQALREKLRNRR